MKSISSLSLAQTENSRDRRTTKLLNLLIVKLHFLGDYVEHIRHFGTTDSYLTQIVRSLFSRSVAVTIDDICLGGACTSPD